ncbi:gluconokinase [Shewanella kaireitica]|uniref:gluconokinase n=1 Tax=Shewanella kaireitica TaxID=212021 RepID=UPI00200EB7F5|nr:gluconokinase, GntK/IdnK-type [Shewanella kaireitica]MCL1092328.1 gluconokinase, GntK/IdnK-type [Shewanella kaireitica]
MNTSSALPQLIIVMGVSGCGKSTLARRLANVLAAQFIEADDFHSAAAKACMAQGIALTDEQRQPWIGRLLHQVNNLTELQTTVLAFSGLKRSHRDCFRALGYRTLFIWLAVDEIEVLQRLSNRKDHFFPASLLKSQLSALEQPTDELDVLILCQNENIEEQIVRLLKVFSVKVIDNKLGV